ncbi:hypothetical protein DL96DRAFT_5009 [Flagelloscypha sp. PMI_526]|nr:hypothetical protein DL96DRAFT_5009 [Flagelloscypha sp. PMI_526]
MSTNKFPAPKASHLRLVLFQKFPGTNVSEATQSTTEPALYLDIPITVLNSFSPYPRKFLRFLAFAVLGYECTIFRDNVNIGDIGDVVGCTVYHARSNTSAVETMDNMIDPYVTARRASTHTKTEHRYNLTTRLEGRDYTNIFGPTPPVSAVGTHIIPFARGSEWLSMLLKARLKEPSDHVKSFNDINDLRNCFLTSADLQLEFDAKRVAIIKTPNCILKMDDLFQTVRPIPDRPDSNLSFPNNERYTLHYILDPSQLGPTGFAYPPNIDAKFKTSTTIPKPPGVLLHYHYGSAVLLQWGNKAKFPKGSFSRPQAAPMVPAYGPPSVTTDRLAIRATLRQARSLASVSKEPSEGDDIDMGDVPYEEWLMMVLGVSNPDTRARLDEEKQAFQSAIQQWAEQVE